MGTARVALITYVNTREIQIPLVIRTSKQKFVIRGVRLSAGKIHAASNLHTVDEKIHRRPVECHSNLLPDIEREHIGECGRLLPTVGSAEAEAQSSPDPLQGRHAVRISAVVSNQSLRSRVVCKTRPIFRFDPHDQREVAVVEIQRSARRDVVPVPFVHVEAVHIFTARRRQLGVTKPFAQYAGFERWTRAASVSIVQVPVLIRIRGLACHNVCRRRQVRRAKGSAAVEAEVQHWPRSQHRHLRPCQ